MLIFHEGLPGSGKSYECVLSHIVPSLSKGREVFAYIEGLNFEKLAELSGITLELCQKLLHQVTREQVYELYKIATPNSLVVIDELQNFFPQGRQKLDENIVRWVSEHRHDGQDIICMGQNFKDCHALFRRRTERKVLFVKLSALGMDKRYQWTAYQAVPQASGDPVYEKINSSIVVYDSKYFGSYASHNSDDISTEHYKDARFNVFRTGLFRFAIPAIFLGSIVAVWYVYGLFHNDKAFASDKAAPKKESKVIAEPIQKSTASIPKTDLTTDERIELQSLREQVAAYKDNFSPRYANHPESAPAYDDLRKIVNMPQVQACIRSGDDCRCYTAQGTRASVTDLFCNQFVSGERQFNPYSTDGATSASVPRNEPQKADVAKSKA